MLKNKVVQCLITALLYLLSTTSVIGQITVTGQVTEPDGLTPIPFALIAYEEQGITVSSDATGGFSLAVPSLPITLKVSSFSFRTTQQIIKDAPVLITLEKDPLLLESIVISDYQTQSDLLQSQNALTIIGDPSSQAATGIASLISEVPGVFIDGSLGEVYSRVYTRGIAASAEDDIGWYYQSLQEDGLPITTIQYNYFTPDFFFRPDLATQRMEALRGGKSGILFQNAPGGSFNFINQGFSSSTQTTLRSTLGLVGESNLYYKLEGMTTVALDEQLSIMLSGMYRYDRGARTTEYPWNKGGQLKGKIHKVISNGSLSFTAKYLNDHVNRYTGMAAQNWSAPEPAFGQSFNYTALMLPALENTIPSAQGYDFDTADGIHVKDFSMQANIDFDISTWLIDWKLKYSTKSIDWNTSFANQPLGLDNFLAYFVSGATFPFGTVTFADARSGETLAVVNNTEALNVFQGGAAAFSYIDGSLPNDALLGIAPWKKQDQLSEYSSQLSVMKIIGDHQLSFGGFYAQSSLDYFTNASFAYATYELEPRLLTASVTDFEGNNVAISDQLGMSNYGGLFFESGRFDVSQYALYLNDHYSITPRLTADLGLRFESVSHRGALDVPAAVDQAGGLDGDPSTQYDQSFQAASGVSQDLNFLYQYLSYSGSLQYALTDQQYVYLRLSHGNKAPELNNYIQNFSGLPIENPSAVQGITQAELSYKMQTPIIGMTLTGFLSELSNVGVSDFLFDQQTNDIFYTPLQTNATRTTGVELSWSAKISDHISFRGSQTFQQSKATTFTVYQPNGSADTADDSIIDFSGNELAHIPAIMSTINIDGRYGPLSYSLNWKYMGKRFGNAENSFTLPAYHTFGLNLNYGITTQLKASLMVNNLFNAAGLANFFGPNEFGSSANNASADYIAQNPNASYVVFPILPRSSYLSISYSF